MFEKFKKVYNLLEDEESKEIFLSRLEYNVSSDESAFKKMLDSVKHYNQKYNPKFVKYLQDGELLNLSKNKKGFILWCRRIC